MVTHSLSAHALHAFESHLFAGGGGEVGGAVGVVIKGKPLQEQGSPETIRLSFGSGADVRTPTPRADTRRGG